MSLTPVWILLGHAFRYREFMSACEALMKAGHGWALLLVKSV